MRATARSSESHSMPAIASRGRSSLPPAGSQSVAPRTTPSRRYRSAGVKSGGASAGGGVGVASGGAGGGATLGGATLGGAALGGATLGGADGATGLGDGIGEGTIGAALHAARKTVATSEAARTNLDIVDSECVDG